MSRWRFGFEEVAQARIEIAEWIIVGVGVGGLGIGFTGAPEPAHGVCVELWKIEKKKLRDPGRRD